MFAKKLLSIVSALFIGSQLISVVNADAAELTSCASLTNYLADGCTSSGGSGKYCLDSGILYEYDDGEDSDPKACVTIGDPLNVSHGDIKVFIDDGTSAGGALLGATDVNGSNKDKLKMYHCFGISNVDCKQTFGYHLANGQYLTIHGSGTNDYKTKGELPLKSTVDALNNCEPGQLYNNDGTVILCISNTPNVFSGDISGDVKKYVMKNVEGNVFTNVGSGHDTEDIIVQVGGGNVILANNGYDYCAKTGAEVNETFNEFCESGNTGANDPCVSAPYVCGGTGVCTRNIVECEVKASGSDCENGYYIVNESGLSVDVYPKIKSNGIDGTMFKCVNGECTKALATADYDASGAGAGYYINQYGNGIPYIKCHTDVAHCTAVGISDRCDAVGKIINDGGFKLCLDIGVASGVLGTATGSHFISINTETVFGETANKYVEVNLKADGSVNLPIADTANTKYVYTDGTYKIYLRAGKDGVCDVSDGTIVEFKQNTGYEKHAEAKRPQHD